MKRWLGVVGLWVARWLGVLGLWVGGVIIMCSGLLFLGILLAGTDLFQLLGLFLDLSAVFRLLMILVALCAAALLPALIFAELKQGKRSREQAKSHRRHEQAKPREQEEARLRQDAGSGADDLVLSQYHQGRGRFHPYGVKKTDIAEPREQEVARRRQDASSGADDLPLSQYHEGRGRLHPYGVKKTDIAKVLPYTVACRFRANPEEASAYCQEMTRFYTERLSIERFVVGDEQAGVRSPYPVEMTPAETVLLSRISSRFDPSCLLLDTYLDKGVGRTTQIDIMAICRHGVFVFESKGLGGTWSGKCEDKEWKQQSSELRIYNPIRQNALHVESVYRVLGGQEEDSDTFPSNPKSLPRNVYSLIVFNDDARWPDLKFLPERCYVTKPLRVNEVIDEILSGEPVFSDAEVMALAYQIRKHRVVPTGEVREAHIRDIQRAIGRDRVLE